MTETGLLIAQGAFLVLLYLFVWSLVRSSSRDLRDTEPVVVQQASDTRQPVDPFEDELPAEPVPAPPEAPAVVPLPPVDVAEADVPAPAVEPDVPDRSQRRPTGPALDLSVNIHPRLVVERSPSLAPDSEYPLEAGMTIGRSRSNGIPLSDQFVSHMHARVFPNGQFFFIEDLGSTNGTFLNGHKIEEPTQLKVRDQVSFGDTVLRYEE